MVIAILCLLGTIGLPIIFPNPTSAQSTAIDVVEHGFSGAVGALFGVLGGKLA